MAQNEVIVISDEEDSVNRKTSEITSIVISDGEDEVVESMKTRGDVTERIVISSSAKSEPCRPLKKFKFSENGVKKLQAQVKLIDIGNSKKPLKLSPVKKETGEGVATSSAECEETSSSVDQVKTEKDDKIVGESRMNLFEKFCSDKKEITGKKPVKVNKSFDGYKHKKSKSPCQSPSSLKQGKITAESFSPKKRPPLHGIVRDEELLLYTVPLHCTVPLKKSELVSKQEASLSKTFTENQLNSLEALKEENFHKTFLTTVTSFMSPCRKPPPSLLFYLFKNILLSKQSGYGTECFRILLQIQELHPAQAAQMLRLKITWECVSMIVKLAGCSQFHTVESFKQNASMALSFLINVMEKEVEKKKFSLVKTNAHQFFSVDRSSGNIHDVVEWIQKATEQHCVERLDQHCGHNFCPLYLLQRMLQLSMLVSQRPEDTAVRLANDLVLAYVELPSVKYKTLLLQSIQSHFLKTKLIEVVMKNCCAIDNESGAEITTSFGLKYVVFNFKRSPPLSNGIVSTTNCEEFVMLLAYWLQSFIFCRKRTLTAKGKDSQRVMSQDDIEVLREIEQEVLMLTGRLEALCGSSLSPRSYQLLQLIVSLKSFAEIL